MNLSLQTCPCLPQVIYKPTEFHEILYLPNRLGSKLSYIAAMHKIVKAIKTTLEETNFNKNVLCSFMVHT